MSFLIGQTVGDYAILQELGNGGAGRVYKVEHTITRRREAMKVLAADKPDSADQAERFFREIRLQASLSHPNIARVLTAFWADDQLALVCELLEGESLRGLLERGPLPLSLALDTISQVLSALSYAHAHGVVHRDVSPANIFVTAAGGTVKLIDFGFARAAADLRLTQDGLAIGTPHYMSPEQVQGLQTLDARTDIYACGAVLYEMTTGRKPFDGDSAFAIMLGHAERAPDPPRSVDAAIPEALDAVILQALAKKPEERFQSADSFRQAVEYIRRDLEQPAPGRGAARHARPSAVLTWVIGLILGGAVLAAGIQWTLRRHAPEQSRELAPALSSAPVPEQAVISSTPPQSAKAPPPTHSEAPRPSVTSPTTHKNPLVKVGGALKHLNPFRRKEPRPAATETQP